MRTAAAMTPVGVGSSVLPIAREGVAGGVIGAAAVAMWFLIVDTIAGQPFYTPAVLGAGVFRGLSATELTQMPESVGWLIVGYTVVHGVAFIFAGLIIALAVSLFERTPALIFPGFFFLLVFFEFVYYMYVLAFVEPVLGAISWPQVLVGNLVAVGSMAAFFWRQHADLLPRLASD